MPHSARIGSVGAVPLSRAPTPAWRHRWGQRVYLGQQGWRAAGPADHPGVVWSHRDKLRTFVSPSDDPHDSHCSIEETAAMAVRVKNAGMHVVINCIFDDTWNSRRQASNAGCLSLDDGQADARGHGRVRLPLHERSQALRSARQGRRSGTSTASPVVHVEYGGLSGKPARARDSLSAFITGRRTSAGWHLLLGASRLCTVQGWLQQLRLGSHHASPRRRFCRHALSRHLLLTCSGGASMPL